MSVLQFGSAKARAGQKAWGQLRVREGKKQVRLPVAVINGRRDGEHVVMLANQHGSEYNGIESIRRFCEEVDPGKMRGSVFAVPSANPRAAMLVNEFFPEDVPPDEVSAYRSGRNRDASYDRNANPLNMNRRWPGQKGSGLLVDRMVYEIWNRAVMAPHRRASLFLDFHCHQSPSCIYAALPEDIDLAVASGIGAVIFTRSLWQPPKLNYSRTACFNEGIMGLTVELGGQRAVNPVAVEAGRRGICNLLKFWGMLPGRLDLPERTPILDPWRNDVETRKFTTLSYAQYNAVHPGIVAEFRHSFGKVRKGELVCHVTDPFTGRVVEEGRAPMTGVLYTPPMAEAVCERGQRLFAVCIAKSVRTVDYVRRLDPARYIQNAPVNPW